MKKASPSESHRIRNWKWMSLSISNYWNSHFTCVCIGCIIYACEVRWTSELNLQFHFFATTVQSGLNKFITAIFESRCRLFFFFLASVSSIINVKTGTKYVQENSECGWHRRMFALWVPSFYLMNSAKCIETRTISRRCSDFFFDHFADRIWIRILIRSTQLE